ncbi:ORM1-like protein 1 isoform X1 [Asparagus officinalis]|uniref:ORM1-like protein 1 isoform X1 n=1 Tax=Asparagus officinalis TaxID=4686 RepID=UPI00098E4DDF|nr:ORM1-like protein 1 isoform X1 [Asparagus officinalis]
MAKLYETMVTPPDVNKNTEWFMYPGVWTTYILILFFAWLIVLSLFRCTPGIAWTIVNLCHFIITYHFFHWKKGTPFAEDQGVYNTLTWWEQIDNGKQLTRNRKFLTVAPVVLFYLDLTPSDVPILESFLPIIMWKTKRRQQLIVSKKSFYLFCSHEFPSLFCADFKGFW